MSAHYPPVGRCIYCGATAFAPDSDRRLAPEHIIPYALGGDVELPEASCRACERVTGNIESIALNSHLLSVRRTLGLHSRTKKSKRKPQKLTIMRGGRSTKIEVTDEQSPAVLFLPVLNEAPILRELPYRGHPNDLLLDYYQYYFDANARTIMHDLDVEALLSPPLDMLIWLRLVAKVAHAWTVAELGIDGFVPLLADILRNPDRNAHAIQNYVGGSPFMPRDRRGHAVNISRHTVNGTTFVIADVTLFAALDAPTYRVAVGYVRGSKPPVLPEKQPMVFSFARSR